VFLGTVTGRFFPNPTNAGGFTAKPGDTEAFSQTFPAINFNPPAGTVPCSNSTGVDVNTRPFTDVVPRPDGSCLVIIAEGNGQQAGVENAAGNLYSFNAVFRGQLSVSAPAQVTFNFFSSDGWILNLGPEQNAGGQPTYVSGPMSNPPPAGPFSGYRVVGSFNGSSSSARNDLVVDFPAAGSYPFELDYSECCAGELAMTLTANGQAISLSYAISASAGPGGSINPTGLIPITSGTTQAFTITPAACYDVADVLVDANSVGAVTTYTFSNVTANHTIAASFRLKTYGIVASAGTGGSISPAGNVSVGCGASQSFTIAPDAGHHIADVLVDGGSVGAVGRYLFNDVVSSHTIVASFATTTFTITASAGSGGVIAPSGAVGVGQGASQSFTVTPAVCYDVADIKVDDVSKGAITSYEFINVQADHTIAASFRLKTYEIVAAAGAGGSISPAGNVSVGCGASQSFTIAPDAGYHIADVLVDGGSVGAVTTYGFQDVIKSHRISASFGSTVQNLSPLCDQAKAVPTTLWPPNHKLVPIGIVGISDPDGDPVTITVTGVTQDEPLDGAGDGNTCADAVLENGAAQVRAERSGGGDGRVYTIAFTATDGRGGSCDGFVEVSVPHDQGRGHASVKGALVVRSLGPCPEDPIGSAGVATLTVGAQTGGMANLQYSIPEAGDVRITLYDVLGRRVATLEDAPRGAGSHQLAWSTLGLVRGLYFCRLNAGQTSVTKTLLVLR